MTIVTDSQSLDKEGRATNFEPDRSICQSKIEIHCILNSSIHAVGHKSQTRYCSDFGYPNFSNADQAWIHQRLPCVSLEVQFQHEASVSAFFEPSPMELAPWS